MVVLMAVLFCSVVYAGEDSDKKDGEKSFVEEIKDKIKEDTATQVNRVIDNIAGHAGDAAVSLSKNLGVAVKDMKPAIMHVISEYRWRGIGQIVCGIFALCFSIFLVRYGTKTVSSTQWNNNEDFKMTTGIFSNIIGLLLIIFAVIVCYVGMLKATSPTVELIKDVAAIATGNSHSSNRR